MRRIQAYLTHPTVGRFLVRDPGGYQASGLNLYAYCGNNPVNLTDSSGMVPDTWLAAKARAEWTRPVHVYYQNGTKPGNFFTGAVFFIVSGPEGATIEEGGGAAGQIVEGLGEGKVVQLGQKGTAAEQAMADNLAKRGFSVGTRFGLKGADFVLNGSEEWELKTVRTGGVTRALRELARAAGQAKKVILDMANRSVSAEEAKSIIARAAGTGRLNSFDTIWIYGENADYIWMKAAP